MMIEVLLSLSLVSIDDPTPSPEASKKSQLSIKVDRLNELHDQEIASSAEIVLPFSPTHKDFLSCVPRESIAYPKALPTDWFDKIFTQDEMFDLMKCSDSSCAFNFTPLELKQFESLKTPGERQTLFLKFYDDRVKGLMGIDPRKSAIFIRSKDNAFSECGTAPELSKLLNQRPIRDFDWRLSVSKYSKNMRPTTRLLQGVSYQQDGSFCYGEALVFSNHYDVDRVEVWSLTRGTGWPRLKLQLRHRIDLLNSWARRLSKEKFRKEADEVVESDLTEAFKCLEEASKPKPSPSPQAKKGPAVAPKNTPAKSSTPAKN